MVYHEDDTHLPGITNLTASRILMSCLAAFFGGAELIDTADALAPVFPAFVPAELLTDAAIVDISNYGPYSESSLLQAYATLYEDENDRRAREVEVSIVNRIICALNSSPPPEDDFDELVLEIPDDPDTFFAEYYVDWQVFHYDKEQPWYWVNFSQMGLPTASYAINLTEEEPLILPIIYQPPDTADYSCVSSE